MALHLAGVWACQNQRVAVIDADPQGCALECSEMRVQERLPRRFTVIGLTRNTLHREAPTIAGDVDRVIVDAPSHVAALTRSALLTADLVLVPVQPPPFVRAAFAETLRLVNEANAFRPRLRTRIVLNRRDAHDVDAHEIAQALAKSDPPVLTSCIGRRAILAEAVVTGRLAFEMAHSTAAAKEITALAAEVERIVTSRDPNSAFVTRTRSPDTWIGERDANACEARPARATIDTTVLCPRTKISLFRAGTPSQRRAHSVNLLTSHVRDTA